MGGLRVPEFPSPCTFCCNACIGALTGDSLGSPQTHDAGSISTEFFFQLFYASLRDPNVPCPLPKPQNREQFVASLEPTHAANRLTCVLPPAEAFLALVLHRLLSSRRCDTDPVTTPLALFVHRPPHDARHTTPFGSPTHIPDPPSRSPSTPPPICRPKWRTRSS